jgi:hypothetical protein
LRAKQKNPDSICNKVTSLILLDFFDFLAPGNRNTIRNIEATSSQTSASSSDR